jgi:hypothetical protein
LLIETVENNDFCEEWIASSTKDEENNNYGDEEADLNKKNKENTPKNKTRKNSAETPDTTKTKTPIIYSYERKAKERRQALAQYMHEKYPPISSLQQNKKKGGNKNNKAKKTMDKSGGNNYETRQKKDKSGANDSKARQKDNNEHAQKNPSHCVSDDDSTTDNSKMTEATGKGTSIKQKADSDKKTISSTSCDSNCSDSVHSNEVSETDDLEDEVDYTTTWVVDCFVRHELEKKNKKKKRRMMLLTHWKGWPSEANTWEPIEEKAEEEESVVLDYIKKNGDEFLLNYINKNGKKFSQSFLSNVQAFQKVKLCVCIACNP